MRKSKFGAFYNLLHSNELKRKITGKAPTVKSSMIAGYIKSPIFAVLPQYRTYVTGLY